MRILFITLIILSNIAQAKDYIFISAATGGLGSNIAESLAKNGNNIILAGRNKKKLARLKDKISKDYDVDIKIAKFDYLDLDSLRKVASEEISGAVIIPPRNHFETRMIPAAKEWKRALNESFVGPLELIRNLTLKIKDKSSIVIISGITSKFYSPNYPNTNVIKTMWAAEVKNLCHQFAGKVRFNVVSPGYILTDFNIKGLKQKAATVGQDLKQQLISGASKLPSRKFGAPKDVSSMVQYILKPESSYLNCTNIALDGGISRAY